MSEVMPPKKTAAQLDAEIAEILRTRTWEDYLEAIPHLEFKPVDSQTWSTIRDEGLDQEQGAPKREQWTAATLPISQTDANGLRHFDAATVEKFNGFDIALKRAYADRVVDLVDYDNGTIRLVTTKRKLSAVLGDA